MSEEYDEDQAGAEGSAGPGAPTPLSALEVCADGMACEATTNKKLTLILMTLGYFWPHEARHSTRR